MNGGPATAEALTPHPLVAGAMAEHLARPRSIGKLENQCLDRIRRHHAEWPAKGYTFDAARAQKSVDFVERYCKHYKGEWAGQPMLLEPWQKLVQYEVFGWVDALGFRVVRMSWVEVARKNGKSQWAGAIAVYLLVADGEHGAEVYSSAPLSLTTPIPTPTGWTTMADIRVGDFVFNEMGVPTRVSYVGPVLRERKCYTLQFRGGQEIVADASHRWATRAVAVGSLAGVPKAAWSPGAVRAENRVYTTEQIHATARTPWGTLNHAIDVAGPLDLPGDPLLPVGPYTLGVWLGDGRQNRGAIVIHPRDYEMVEAIHTEGYETSRHGLNGGDGLLRFTVLGLRTQLRCAGILGNKHVPIQYLRASIEQRRALVCGLMDSDGTCTKTGECRFTNRNQLLAEGLHELVISLGLRATLRETEVTGKPHYVVSFRAPQSRSVFQLNRKRKRQVEKLTIKVRRRVITGIAPTPSVPVRCISVESPSSLYLVGRHMIATHNTKRDQARIVFNAGKQMVRQNAALSRNVKVHRTQMTCGRLGSVFLPLSSEARTLDGLDPHGNIVDEIHAHRTREVWDVLDTAMAARRQPLTWVITTAGIYDPEQIGWQQHEYALQVLEGVISDDSLFVWISAANVAENRVEGDDRPQPPGVEWEHGDTALEQANPNWGVSTNPGYLRKQRDKARVQASFTNTFKRLHLNQWTQAKKLWINLEQWRQCGGPLPAAEVLAALECWGGIDLSSKIDLTAFVLAFYDEDQDVWYLRVWFFMPGDDIGERSRKDRVPYDRWAEQGWITLTDGNVIDYEYIIATVLDAEEEYGLLELGFDPWNAEQTAIKLEQEGITMVRMRQGYATLSEPTKEFEKLVVGGSLRHGDNPVLTWMANNTMVVSDAAGNIKIDKSKSIKRIDGVAAAIMAIGRGIISEGGSSVYDNRGLTVIS